jgi:hypothetical protein
VDLVHRIRLVCWCKCRFNGRYADIDGKRRVSGVTRLPVEQTAIVHENNIDSRRELQYLSQTVLLFLVRKRFTVKLAWELVEAEIDILLRLQNRIAASSTSVFDFFMPEINGFTAASAWLHVGFKAPTHGLRGVSCTQWRHHLLQSDNFADGIRLFSMSCRYPVQSGFTVLT